MAKRRKFETVIIEKKYRTISATPTREFVERFPDMDYSVERKEYLYVAPCCGRVSVYRFGNSSRYSGYVILSDMEEVERLFQIESTETEVFKTEHKREVADV